MITSKKDITKTSLNAVRMNYYIIDTEVEPKITGSNNGVYSVEIRDKYSFFSPEDKKVWRSYCSENRKNKSKVSFNDYTPLDISLLSGPITFFPIGKKIKQLDFMAFAPYEHGIQFLITKRVYDIVSRYRLPIHNKIPAKIDGFEYQYFLVGFPMAEIDAFDFNQSVFKNYSEGREITFKDIDEYNTYHNMGAYIVPKKIKLKEKFSFDIIETIKGTFFAADIITELRKENITGYREKEGVLELKRNV